MKANRPTQKNHGMSLVEVALALGILSFTMVAIMGLLPVGLAASRQSIDKALELEIRQSLMAWMISYPFSALPESGSFHYNAEAVRLAAGADPAEIRYEVEYSVADSTALPATQSAPYLRTVEFVIHNVETGREVSGSLHLPDNGL